MLRGKTILIAPLDWGLGHASRCVPVIRQFLESENKVIIGVTPVTRHLIRQYFPDLVLVEVPSYNVSYSSVLPAWLSVISKIPRLAATIRKESRRVSALVSEFAPDMIISDNRPGFIHPVVPSVYITHQVQIAAGILSRVPSKLHHRFINRFSELWIPDCADVTISLAGKLSGIENIHIPVTYIGPLSALNKKSVDNEFRSDIAVILSGPEPQRTILERKLYSILKSSDKRIIFVRGTNADSDIQNFKNLSTYNQISGSQLEAIINGATTVVCRSGYSTLMDLFLLEKKDVVLIPTPGQIEQEYLASYHGKQFKARIVKQKDVSTETILNQK